MKRKPVRRLPRLLRAVLPPAGFLVASLLPALLPADWMMSRLWKGYYTLFAGSAVPAAGGPARVVRDTAPVCFNTLAGMASLSVADLPARLDGDDPRLDPYLRKVDGYFQVPGGRAGRQLVYVRTQRPALFAGLGRLDAQVLELDPAGLLIRLAALAGAALLILLPAQAPHVPRWLLCLGLLPWATSAAAGDLRDLLAFFLAFPLWVRGMAWAAESRPAETKGKGKRRPKRGAKRKPGPKRKAGRRRASRRPAFPYLPAGLAALGAAVFFLAAPGVMHLAGALCAIGADLFLLAALPAARRWEGSRRAHALFRALPILGALQAQRARRRGRRLPPAGWAVPAALALLAFASVGALALEAHRRDLSAPRLQAGGHPGLSWSALAELPLARGGLPNLADYLAHRAFQEGLAFGRPYRVPAPGERAYLSAYTPAGSGYVQTFRVARRVPESWLRYTLEAARPGSVERMLADQGRAAAVELADEPGLLRDLRPLPRAAALSLFLLACLTAAVLSGTRTFAL